MLISPLVGSDAFGEDDVFGCLSSHGFPPRWKFCWEWCFWLGFSQTRRRIQLQVRGGGGCPLLGWRTQIATLAANAGRVLLGNGDLERKTCRETGAVTVRRWVRNCGIYMCCKQWKDWEEGWSAVLLQCHCQKCLEKEKCSFLAWNWTFFLLRVLRFLVRWCPLVPSRSWSSCLVPGEVSSCVFRIVQSQLLTCPLVLWGHSGSSLPPLPAFIAESSSFPSLPPSFPCRDARAPAAAATLPKNGYFCIKLLSCCRAWSCEAFTGSWRKLQPFSITPSWTIGQIVIILWVNRIAGCWYL